MVMPERLKCVVDNDSSTSAGRQHMRAPLAAATRGRSLAHKCVCNEVTGPRLVQIEVQQMHPIPQRV